MSHTILNYFLKKEKSSMQFIVGLLIFRLCVALLHKSDAPHQKKIRQNYFSNSLKSTHIIYNINKIHKLFNKFERKKKCLFLTCKEVCVSILSKPTQLQHEIVVLYSIILNVMVMFFLSYFILFNYFLNQHFLLRCLFPLYKKVSKMKNCLI